MAITPLQAAVFLEDKYVRDLAEAERYCDEYLSTHYINGEPCCVYITVSDRVLQGLEKVYDLWNIETHSQFSDDCLIFTALETKPTSQDVVTTPIYYNEW